MKIRFICRKHEIDLTIENQSDAQGPVNMTVLYHLGDKEYAFDHSFMWCEKAELVDDAANCVETWSVNLDME